MILLSKANANKRIEIRNFQIQNLLIPLYIQTNCKSFWHKTRQVLAKNKK